MSELGNLALSGSLDKTSLLAEARVTTEATAQVTRNLVDRLPLVPAAILQELQIKDGDVTGSLTVTFDLPKKALHCRVDLDATNTRLYLPSVTVAVQNGRAKVTIDDNLVHVRAAKGHALDGTVFADGELAFHGPITRLTLSLKAEKLNINDVPESWGIPATVQKSIASGKLFGGANVDLTIGDARVIATAAATLVARAGSWIDDAALVAAFPRDQIRIESEGKGEVRDAAGKIEPIEFNWQLAPGMQHARIDARSRRGKAKNDRIDYEIASYGTVRTWAAQLGLENAVTVLEETLNEEKANDAKLTELSTAVNEEAQGETEEPNRNGCKVARKG